VAKRDVNVIRPASNFNASHTLIIRFRWMLNRYCADKFTLFEPLAS